MEGLITPVEQEYISMVSKTDPDASNDLISGTGDLRLTICKISLKNKLIFIEGTSQTGIKHIISGYKYWPYTHNWKLTDGIATFELINPEQNPVNKLAALADILYSGENLNIEKNKRSDIFDMFSANIKDKNGNAATYNMFLYKNTRIVHSIIPSNMIRQGDHFINLKRGDSTGSFDQFNKTQIIAIPFRDQHNKTPFSYQIVKNYFYNSDIRYVVNHATNEKWEVLSSRFEPETMDFLTFKKDQKEANKLDLTFIELLILQLEFKNKMATMPNNRSKSMVPKGN